MFEKDFWEELPNRIQTVISISLQLAIVTLIVVLFYRQQWFSAASGLLILLLTFMPAILARQLSLQLPVEFTLITTVFLYASFVLGEISDFYYRFWWWDLMLHSISALIVALIGFLMIYVFYMAGRIRIPPVYIATMTLSLAVMVGTIWEIFEFGMDWLFNMNMQKSGLVDTMTDLIMNFCSASIAAILGYYYVKNGDSLLVDRMVRRFVAKNPRLLRLKKSAEKKSEP
jgi:hypothetical protein